METELTWKVFAFGSAFFAALTAIFGKIGVNEINSNMATLIRTVVILGVSALWVSVRKDWVSISAMSSKGIVFLVLSGIATGLSWLCYYKALQVGDASKVAPVDKFSVVLVVVLAVLFLGESLSLKSGIGIGLIFCGTVLMVL